MNLSGEKILEACSGIYNSMIGPVSDNIARKDGFGTPWSNPDNIAFGNAGTVFFMLELYRHTKDDHIWNDITGRLEKIEQHCAQVKTNNYSLYTGRLGLAKLYLEIFRLTGEQRFLSKSVKTCYSYFDERSGNLKFFDNCSLIDGFAGIVLFCLDLYKDIKHEWLLDSIRAGTRILLDKAELNSKGMYWNGLTNINRRQLGWGYGGSGVALVFSELAALFNSRHFLQYARQAFKYEDNHGQYNESLQPLPANDGIRSDRYSLLHGKTGGDLVRLYTDLLENGAACTALQHINTDPGALVAAAHARDIDALSYYRLAAYGLVLKQAYSLTHDNNYLDRAKNIATILLNDFLKGNPHTDVQTGFFEALPGVGYFLLSLLHPEQNSALLMAAGPGPVKMIDAQVDDAIGLFQLQSFNRLLIQKNFSVSLSLLEKKFPDAIAAFPGETSADPVNDFTRLVDQLDKKVLAENELDELLHSFRYESFVTNIKQIIDERSFLDEQVYKKNIQDLCRLTDADLLNLQVRLSEHVWLINLEPPAWQNGRLSQSGADELILRYGAGSYSAQLNKFNELEIIPLLTVKLLLDILQKPMQAGDLLDQLLQFFTDQPEDVINVLQQRFEVEKREELFPKIRATIIDKIKQLLLSGLITAIAFERNNG